MTVVYIDNSNAILLEGLHGEVDGVYMNDAYVTVVIKDTAGGTVAGSALSLTYVTNSNGNYRAVLPDTIVMLAERRYVAEIVADAGNDRVARWKVPFYTQVRQ